MKAHTGHFISTGEARGFIAYGVLFIVLSVVWMITFFDLSHGFHRSELWPVSGMVAAGMGFLSRERWQVVVSSTLLAFTGLCIALVMSFPLRWENVVFASGLVLFSFSPGFLCVHRWRSFQ